MSAVALRMPAPEPNAGRGRLVALAAWLALLAAGALVFAHGCHGGDADHEPLTWVR